MYSMSSPYMYMCSRVLEGVGWAHFYRPAHSCFFLFYLPSVCIWKIGDWLFQGTWSESNIRRPSSLRTSHRLCSKMSSDQNWLILHRRRHYLLNEGHCQRLLGLWSLSWSNVRSWRPEKAIQWPRMFRLTTDKQRLGRILTLRSQ